MKTIPEILLKAPFLKTFKITALMPVFGTMIFVTSCSYSGVEKLVDSYSDKSPITLSEYDYNTDEPAKISFTDFKDYKFKLSTETFYVKRTLHLTDSYLDNGKAFHEAEERRQAQKYLTLR